MPVVEVKSEPRYYPVLSAHEAGVSRGATHSLPLDLGFMSRKGRCTQHDYVIQGPVVSKTFSLSGG